MQSHYEVLGVAPDADVAAIKRAWHVKVLLLHPDKHVDAPEAVRAEALRETRQINDAWATLKDSDRRRRYDLELARLVDASADDARPRVFRPLSLEADRSAGPARVSGLWHDATDRGRRRTIRVFEVQGTVAPRGVRQVLHARTGAGTVGEVGVRGLRAGAPVGLGWGSEANQVRPVQDLDRDRERRAGLPVPRLPTRVSAVRLRGLHVVLSVGPAPLALSELPEVEPPSGRSGGRSGSLDPTLAGCPRDRCARCRGRFDGPHRSPARRGCTGRRERRRRSHRGRRRSGCGLVERRASRRNREPPRLQRLRARRSAYHPSGRHRRPVHPRVDRRLRRGLDHPHGRSRRQHGAARCPEPWSLNRSRRRGDGRCSRCEP